MAAPKGTIVPNAKPRQKGTQNKVTKALKDMILGALDGAGGERYLQAQANQNPTAFLSLIGRVLPTTLATDPNAPLKLVIERKVFK